LEKKDQEKMIATMFDGEESTNNK